MRWQVGLAATLLVTGAPSIALAEGEGRGAVKPQVVASAGATGGAEKPAAGAKAVKVANVGTPGPSSATPMPVTYPALPSKNMQAKPSRPTLVARIDLTRQRMQVSANGQSVGNWKISSGRAGYETPRGYFRPKWISRMHYSRKYYNSPMPYSVFFNGGIATHGTTAVSRLGRPASHGCIRLRTPNARKFYNLVRKHGKARTRIIVTGYAKQSRFAKRSRKRQTTHRRNAFRSRSNRRQRYSVDDYDRRYRERMGRYHRSRRMTWSGNRY